MALSSSFLQIIDTQLLKNQEDYSRSWWIKRADGSIVLATLAEMYDNSIPDVRKEDYSLRKPVINADNRKPVINAESDNRKPVINKVSDNAKTKDKVEQSRVSERKENKYKVKYDTLVLISYIAIAIMISILFPLSYWISLRIYNHLF